MISIPPSGIGGHDHYSMKEEPLTRCPNCNRKSVALLNSKRKYMCLNLNCSYSEVLDK